MVSAQLSRISWFRHLKASELEVLAQHAQLLALPGKRWLLRKRRRLDGVYCLLRGTLRLHGHCGTQRLLKVRQQEVCEPFYVGASGAQLSASESQPQAIYAPQPVLVLRVDLAPLRALLEAADSERRALEVRAEPWLERFFNSALLQRLDPERWQALLRGMQTRTGERGDRIVAEGDRGHYFYVLREGQAVVHRGPNALAYLGPGDFFGEDALISGARRNASVTLLKASTLLTLPRRPFLQLLVRGVVPFHSGPLLPGTRPLTVAPQGRRGVCHLPLNDLRPVIDGLSRAHTYRVEGGSVPARALAVFVLLQRGYRVTAALASTEVEAGVAAELLFEHEVQACLGE